MKDKEPPQSDVDVLKSYEDVSGESELLLGILDLIDIYGDEISDYLVNGTIQELSDFRIDINKTSLALAAEFTHLIGMLAGSDDTPEVISLVANLFRRVNRAYLTAVANGCLCDVCMDYCFDTDIVHQQMYEKLSNSVTHDYNPEQAAMIFTDGISSMNAHLLEHLEPEL